MVRKNTTPVFVLLVLLWGLALSSNAFAIDKRLKLMFKTAGYGAGAGFVLGAGSIALGMGGARNILMGASSGLYAGIALAAYIIATPPQEDVSSERRNGPRNPYAPRRPVGKDDYDEDEEGLKEHLPPQPESSLDNARQAPVQTAFWTPLISLEF